MVITKITSWLRQKGINKVIITKICFYGSGKTKRKMKVGANKIIGWDS